MTKYRENPACLEQKTPKDVLANRSEAEQKAVKTMTKEEIRYLMNDCCILEYVNFLRKGAQNEVLGSDYPVLVIKGNKLQLERYKLVFLLTLIDFKGERTFYPSDFVLGSSIMDEAKEFTGVAYIKVPKDCATSEGLDEHRSELIAGVLATRRDLFNPTLVLAEESIAGKLNTSSELVKIIVLDPDKLRGSYDEEEKVVIDTSVVSRDNTKVKVITQNYTPKVVKETYNSPSYKRKGKSSEKVSAVELRKACLREMDEQDS